VDTWKSAIDEAIELCGSVNGLAEHLGAHKSAVSSARTGKQPLSAEKLAILAELLETNAAELWELQEVANMSRRNPFLRLAQAASAAFLGVVLSVAPSDANAVAIGPNWQNAVSELNAHCRQLTRLTRRVLAGVLARLFRTRTRHATC
jgi:plasmid maintenance system antidote protein VapI